MSVDSQVKEDRPPHARFQRRAVENEIRSKEEGHYVGEDVDFVTVTAPYSNGKESVDYRVDKWFAKLEQHVKIGKFKPEWLRKIRDQSPAGSATPMHCIGRGSSANGLAPAPVASAGARRDDVDLQ